MDGRKGLHCLYLYVDTIVGGCEVPTSCTCRLWHFATGKPPVPLINKFKDTRWQNVFGWRRPFNKWPTRGMTVAEWSHVALGTFSPHGSMCVVRGSLCHGFSECLCLLFGKSWCTRVWQESKITSTLTKLRRRTVFGGRAIHVGHIVSLWPVNYPGGQLRFGALASTFCYLLHKAE